MNTYVSTVDTPAGPFTVVADDDAVLASGWTSTVDDLLSFVPISPWPLPRADLGVITKATVRLVVDDVPRVRSDDHRCPRRRPVSIAFSRMPDSAAISTCSASVSLISRLAVKERSFSQARTGPSAITISNPPRMELISSPVTMPGTSGSRRRARPPSPAV